MNTAVLERRVREQVMHGILARSGTARGEAERRALVEELAREALDQAASDAARTGDTMPTPEQERQVIRTVIASQLGLGRLEPLLQDDSIENININGHDAVWVKRADGTKEKVQPVADSDEELIELVQRAARAHHAGGERRIDPSKPVVDLQLPGNHRLSAMIDVSHRPCVSIRRHRLTDPVLSDLKDLLSTDLEDFLKAAVRARLNIIISGGTNAGKTTLLRALMAEADPADRIITIELAYELGFHELGHRHPDCVAWEAREANTEGSGAVSMDYLVQRANRHDPDRVIVGEVLGDEIVPMLNAMTAGRNGSMCTIHSDSARGTFGRIASYASQSPKHLTTETAAILTAQALDLVVHVGAHRTSTGQLRRLVTSVLAVDGAEGPHVTSTEIFSQPDGDSPAVPAFSLPDWLRGKLASQDYSAPLGAVLR